MLKSADGLEASGALEASPSSGGSPTRREIEKALEYETSARMVEATARELQKSAREVQFLRHTHEPYTHEPYTHHESLQSQSNDELEAVFDSIDRNGDGIITKEEFRVAAARGLDLHSSLGLRAPPTPAYTPTRISGPIRNFESPIPSFAAKSGGLLTSASKGLLQTTRSEERSQRNKKTLTLTLTLIGSQRTKKTRERIRDHHDHELRTRERIRDHHDHELGEEGLGSDFYAEFSSVLEDNGYTGCSEVRIEFKY